MLGLAHQKDVQMVRSDAHSYTHTTCSFFDALSYHAWNFMNEIGHFI